MRERRRERPIDFERKRQEFVDFYSRAYAQSDRWPVFVWATCYTWVTNVLDVARRAVRLD